MTPVADRFRWALDVLDPQPTDRILEIGCGHGVAVSLLCAVLPAGRVVGIDRSQGMIDRAERRNRGHVHAGRAAFQAAALADADLGSNVFDKAFAINVRLFRLEGAREADALRRALTPAGALYLFQQHPSAGRTRAVTDELTAALARVGLVVRDVRSTGAGSSLMTCIVAQPRPATAPTAR